MAYQVNHVGGNSSGWTLIDGDAWETVDYPGVGLGLEVLAAGDVVAEFAPGKWSAICTADPSSPSEQSPPLLAPRPLAGPLTGPIGGSGQARAR